MSTPSLQETYQQIDTLINSHEIDRAKSRLHAMDIKSLPSPQRGRFADLARRCGEIKLALKILYPNIHGAERPSPGDLVEYASLVRRFGLVNQALLLLERTPLSSKVNLNKAFCYIHLWEYPAAQSQLESYLEDPELNEKQKLVGQINLLACYIENKRFEVAEQFLDEFEKNCEQHSPHLLLNCQEMRGQILLKTGRVAQAKQVLKKALVKTKQQSDNSSLFIEKWLLIARCQLGELQVNDEAIVQFKKRIRQSENWEVLRDFDWQLARHFSEESLKEKVLFGTPFDGFRRIIMTDDSERQWRSHWVQYGQDADQSGPIFDFYSYEQVPIPFGMSVHRCMMLLTSDQYQPFSVERIFNSLFGEEMFDPISSPKKVYRCLEQIREAIVKYDLPMELISTSNGYRLRPSYGTSFRIHRKMVFLHREEFLSHILKMNGLLDMFKVKDAQNIIPLSVHQWYRAFKSMQDKGVLQISPQSQSFYSLIKESA